MYERSLKEQYPDKTHLGYNVRQLHTWIDKHVCLKLMQHLCALASSDEPLK
jgi:hypothetical protein